MDQDQQRDYAEEAYWRNYCPECGGRCTVASGWSDCRMCDEHGSVEPFYAVPASVLNPGARDARVLYGSHESARCAACGVIHYR